MLRKGSELPEAAVGTQPLPDSKAGASPTKLHSDRPVSKEAALVKSARPLLGPRWGLSNTPSKPPAPAVSPPPGPLPPPPKQSTLPNLQGT